MLDMSTTYCFPALSMKSTPYRSIPNALRCGRAFGIDLYGVDFIESAGKQYVVDMSSIPGFKGVPDAPSHLANYFYAAAERAARGESLWEPPDARRALQAVGLS